MSIIILKYLFYTFTINVVVYYHSDEMPNSITVTNTQNGTSRHHQHKAAEQVCLRLSMGLSFSHTQCHKTVNPSSSALHCTSFSIVIPAGQDISLVYIGWTTQHFKYHPELFQKSSSSDDGDVVGCQVIKVMDNSNSGASAEYVTGYMTCLTDLFKSSHLMRLDSNSDHISSDFVVGCIVDQQMATISYTVNKEPVSSCDIKVCYHTSVTVCEYKCLVAPDLSLC